ncbi:MAG TPA: pyridoxal phosphate-dependent aminotransferase [Thermoanaerobaculia bacterium]|nr:pyridoxal phosphate-dependent aminotransferase [Thermoanaerobaculia bacterium]
MAETTTALRPAARVAGFGTTVFAEMTRLALVHGAVNLGQGFPDFDGPDFLHEAAIRAIREGRNQYCPTGGVPELARAVARHQERFWGLAYAPEEVTVYAGATEAIFAALQALCDPGDEVVLFEPFYDSYLAAVTMAGGVARVVTLRDRGADGDGGAGFAYDPAELAAAVGPRTRAILVNSPHNPTGKVFSWAELEPLAALARKHDLIVVSDEVYEHLVYEGEHVPVASLPGMRERTVTISSAAKTFSVTGWKIGWSCAPPELTRPLQAAHQFITFCNGTPFQYAVAEALAAGDGYYETLRAEYRGRRDRLCTGLEAAGFGVRRPAGTYFVMADIRPLGFDDDIAFCRALPERAGVAAIPPSSFYRNRDAGRHLVRFAFCKTDAVLDEAIRRLRKG